jgi:hypothetical protein
LTQFRYGVFPEAFHALLAQGNGSVSQTARFVSNDQFSGP